MNADTQKYNISLFNGSKDFFRQNNHLKNDSFEKIKILNELKIKANNALLLDSSAIGSKNLLYYSIFGPSFVFLLELSLKTIAKNCNVNFDLLFITDAPTLHMLETIDVLNKFNWDYHLVDTPVDGVEASIQKLQVFAYKNIDLYKERIENLKKGVTIELPRYVRNELPLYTGGIDNTIRYVTMDTIESDIKLACANGISFVEYKIHKHHYPGFRGDNVSFFTEKYYLFSMFYS